MKRWKKMAAMLLTAAILGNVLVSCGTPSETNSPGIPDDMDSELSGSPHTQSGGERTLVIGTTDPVGSFDLSASMAPGTSMVYDTLILMDPETKALTPGVAESWTWSDDFLTCTFHLRDDVTFSNGEKLTAEDVLYSLSRMTTSMTASSFASIDFEQSRAEDDLTLVMVMKWVDAQIEYTLAANNSGICCKSWAETATSEDWWSAPVGSGPYTVAENVDGAYTRYVAREDYWGGVPEASDVTVRVYPDAGTEFIGYQVGEIDVALGLVDADLQRIIQGEVPDTEYIVTSGYDYKVLALCSHVEVLQDPAVREAIACAIDPNACIKASFGSLATPMDSCLPEASSYYASMGQYEYNPDRARQLLSDAGYQDGDIQLRMVIMNNGTDTNLAEVIQAYLGEIGIVVDIESYVTFTAIEMFRQGDCDITLSGSGGGAYDAAVVFGKIDENSTDLSTIVRDEELQALIHQGASSMDPAVREAAYTQAQQIMHDRFYAVPLLNVNIAYCYQSEIASFPIVSTSTFNAFYCHFA